MISKDNGDWFRMADQEKGKITKDSFLKKIHFL